MYPALQETLNVPCPAGNPKCTLPCRKHLRSFSASAAGNVIRLIFFLIWDLTDFKLLKMSLNKKFVYYYLNGETKNW